MVGTRSITRSSVVLAGGSIFSMRTEPSLTMRKPMGSMRMPAPPPPAKPLRCFTRSPPPWPNPKLTRETGTSVTPSGVVMGSPTTVLTSTISLSLDMLAFRNSAIGVCICSIVILPF